MPCFRLSCAAFALLFALFLPAALPAAAQELRAKVSINHSQVQGTSSSIFENLETALTQLMNERRWTNQQ